MSNATPLQTPVHVRERDGDGVIMRVLAWLPPWIDNGGIFVGAGWFLVYSSYGFRCLPAERCEPMQKDALGYFLPVPAKRQTPASGPGGAA